MCGLVGFTEPCSRSRKTLTQMMRPLGYRGPDEDGTHIDSDLAVGHLRLTIIAPDGGQQPRVDEGSGDVLVFNGEIYGTSATRRDWIDWSSNSVSRSDCASISPGPAGGPPALGRCGFQ